MGDITSSFATVRFFLERSQRDGIADFTPMKALKLVYLSHGWVLGFTGKPLITEPVQAWKYGPVIPSIYHYFKRYHSHPIPKEEISSLPSLSIDKDTETVLDSVWNSFKGFTGIELSTMTHTADSPWYQAWHAAGGQKSRGVIIDNEIIRTFYRRIIDGAEKLPANG